jgi:hypothetical protein
VATAAFDTHVPLQLWKLALQATPQLVPSHVATPLPGVAQGEHDVPQFAVLLSDTQAPPHTWKPALQVKPHIVPLQVAVALAGGLHGVHEAPHVLMLVLLTHAPPHGWKPLLQVKPHVPPTHVAVAFAGGEQALHDDPHEAVLVSERHAAPQRWKPALHTKPQLVPSHVADAFAGAVHATHDAPHVATFALLTQLPPQLWKPPLHETPQVAAVHVALPFGTVGHAAQVPQWAGSAARFASHPLAGFLSQSAKPMLQVKPHVPALQVAVAFAGVGHALLHVPQVTVRSSRASQPFVALPSQSPKPMLQLASVHAPLVHAAVAFVIEQLVVHVPQLPTDELRFVSQPFAAMPSQLPNPGRHVPSTHAPAMHDAPAFANAHCWPQPPQFVALVERSVSQPAIMALQSPKPGGQVPVAHVPAAQIAPVPGHTFPHVPQFVGEMPVFVSQPFVALPSQSAKPALHAPSAHIPAVQSGVAFAKVQVLPQAPQFERVSSGVSQPFAAMPSQSPNPAAQVLHVPS